MSKPVMNDVHFTVGNITLCTLDNDPSIGISTTILDAVTCLACLDQHARNCHESVTLAEDANDAH